jgi:hypothetical protein
MKFTSMKQHRGHASLLLVASMVLALSSSSAHAQPYILSPLTSFGGGDGWLAPGELGFNDQTNATVRGIAYNAAANHVYVVDRDGGLRVEVRHGDTGALVSTLDTTGISGGTFAGNMIDVADDGAIYMGNLVVGGTFKVYRWSNEAATPTVAFDGSTGRARTGDSFAVIGSGSDTQIIAAGGTDLGFLRLTTVDGLSFSGGNVAPVGPAGGAFRLGLDFIDAGTVIGAQTGALVNTSPVGGGSGDSFALNSLGEAPLGYYGPKSLLATIDINSNDVRLYDASDLTVLTSTGFQDLANNTSSFVSNANGVGKASFGVGPDGALRVYALNSNNGIQAFVVIPEPASFVMFAVGLGLVGCTRRSRRA